MKGKQLADHSFSLLDAVFEGINNSQRSAGTGKSFSYKLDVSVPGKKDDGLIDTTIGAPKDQSLYSFTVMIREMGHGERQLQTFTFSKPKDLDKHNMESRVILAMFSIFTETCLLQWDELGKMLNVDTELQEVAKKS